MVTPEAESDEQRLARNLEEIQRLPRQIESAAKGLFVSASGAGQPIYTTDFLLMGVAQRTHALLSAIHLLVSRGNCLASAHLIRPLLDCAGTLAAAVKQKDQDGFAKEVMAGATFKELGLTDKKIQGWVNEYLPGASDLYKEASKFVHFSEKHIFAPIKSVEPDGHWTARIGTGSYDWRTSDKNEMLKSALVIGDFVVSCLRTEARQKEKQRGRIGDPP